MGQQWDQGRNQKISWNEWKWGLNNPRSVGHWESNCKRKFIALQAYLEKKREKAQISNLTSHLKELEKEKQRNPKVCRRKGKIKIRTEINKIESE